VPTLIDFVRLISLGQYLSLAAANELAAGRWACCIRRITVLKLSLATYLSDGMEALSQRRSYANCSRFRDEMQFGLEYGKETKSGSRTNRQMAGVILEQHSKKCRIGGQEGVGWCCSATTIALCQSRWLFVECFIVVNVINIQLRS
jgi:hypothetical protein